MINLESILSAFNSKGTLLKWLKIVNEKLDNGQLKSVTVSDQTLSSYRLKFTFNDDTFVVSNVIPIIRGEKGEKGDKGDTPQLYYHKQSITFTANNNVTHHIVAGYISTNGNPLYRGTITDYVNMVRNSQFGINIIIGSGMYQTTPYWIQLNSDDDGMIIYYFDDAEVSEELIIGRGGIPASQITFTDEVTAI